MPNSLSMAFLLPVLLTVASACSSGSSKDPLPQEQTSLAQNLGDSTWQQTPESLDLLPLQLARFIDVFNGEGSQVPSGSIDRGEGIGQLLSSNLRRKAPANLLDEFIKQALSVKIKLEDPALFAEATCKANFQGKKTSISISLQYQAASRQGHSWCIVGATGSIFDGVTLRPSRERSLSPQAHELLFMRLHNDIEENVANFTKQDFETDFTSILLYLIEKNELTIESVENTKIFLLQVPNWIATVEKRPLGRSDAGWRITNLRQVGSAAEKNCYLLDSLHIGPAARNFLEEPCTSDIFQASTTGQPPRPGTESQALALVDSLVLAFNQYHWQNGPSPEFLRQIDRLFNASSARVIDDLTPQPSNQLVPLYVYLQTLTELKTNGVPVQISFELDRKKKPILQEKKGKTYLLVNAIKHIKDKMGKQTIPQVIIIDLHCMKIDCITNKA